MGLTEYTLMPLLELTLMILLDELVFEGSYSFGVRSRFSLYALAFMIVTALLKLDD